MITKEQLDEYIKHYNEGRPDIPDSTYDQLLEEYIQANGENSRPYLRQKQNDIIYNMTSTLSKVYGVTTPMREGQKTYEQWFNTKKINPNSRIIIQPKYDGCSVVVDKDMNFFTRGDYDNGESIDVTELFVNHPNNYLSQLNNSVEGVKCEAIISSEDFHNNGLDKIYYTPRDAVAAIITSRNIEMSKFITLIPLRDAINGNQWVTGALQDVSIATATADDFNTIQQFIVDKLNDGAQVEFNSKHYAIDGVVVSVINEEGITQEEIAIKILNDINETKLINVEFQFGKTGRITPVAIVEPVKFCDGKRTVDHITLSTLERVYNMNLRYGDTVRLMYNIVPYFLESYHDGNIPIQIPTKCPMCGEELDTSTLKQVRCVNPNCRGLKLGSIIRYCSEMKMFGVSTATITKFYDEGLISEISDLYNLKISDITKLAGFKETSASNIINSIHKASTDIPVSRWLGSLPFKDVNSKTWEILLNTVFGRDELKKSNGIIYYIDNDDSTLFLTECLVQHIPNVGVATKRSIHEGWLKNIDEMKKIIHHISFKITTVSNMNTKAKVTLTGFRDKDLISRLAESGYAIQDFNNSTEYLIIPDSNYNNQKTFKAKNMGIPILTKDEAYKTLI